MLRHVAGAGDVGADRRDLPHRVRGPAISIAISALWIACFLLPFTFPVLNAELGAAGAFWLYGAICFAGFVFVKLRVPETKGWTLEQIEEDLKV